MSSASETTLDIVIVKDESPDVLPNNALTASKTSGPNASLTDQTNILPFKKILTVFLGLGLCVFASALDSVVIATSLPTLNDTFHAGAVVSWVPSAYMLTSSAFQPLYGRFSDIFGRKPTLAACMCIFMLGNLLAGFSTSILHVIAFRGLAGVGNGGIQNLMQIVVADIVTLRERGKYQGIINGVTVIGYTVGPLIGGLLSQSVGWKWSFWITIPVSFIATIIVCFVFPLKPVEPGMRRKLMSVDYGGALLILIACTLVMLPLIWGGVTFPWTSPIVLSSLFCGFFLVLIFCVYEWKCARLPIVPMYIFQNFTVSGVYIVMFINGFVFFSTLFYMPQFFQIVLGYTPIGAAMLLIPFLVSQMVTSWLAGLVISKTGQFTQLLHSGFALWAIGCGCISTIGDTTGKAVMIVFMLLAGFGGGMTLQPGIIAAQAAVPRRDVSVVTAFRNFVKSLGGTFALAVGAAISNNRLRYSMEMIYLPEDVIVQIVDEPSSLYDEDFELPPDMKNHILHHGYVKGFAFVFYLNSALCAMAVIVGLLMVKHQDLNIDYEERATLKQQLHEKCDEKERDIELGSTDSSVIEAAISTQMAVISKV